MAIDLPHDVTQTTAYVTGDINGHLLELKHRIINANIPTQSTIIIAGNTGLVYDSPKLIDIPHS